MFVRLRAERNTPDVHLAVRPSGEEVAVDVWTMDQTVGVTETRVVPIHLLRISILVSCPARKAAWRQAGFPQGRALVTIPEGLPHPHVVVCPTSTHRIIKVTNKANMATVVGMALTITGVGEATVAADEEEVQDITRNHQMIPR